MSGLTPDSGAVRRARMVADQIAARGVSDPAVLRVLGAVPRELFVPVAAADRAYEDNALPIDCQQTISQPYIVAAMTAALELTAETAVLEVGAGSGYQTAILASLARTVFTIEWYLKLLNQAAERLAALGLHNVQYRCGDGSLGWPECAPYPAIIVTAAGPRLPAPLLDQLAPGGRLVAPVGPADDQALVRVTRDAGGRFHETELMKCRFVRLMGAAGWGG